MPIGCSHERVNTYPHAYWLFTWKGECLPTCLLVVHMKGWMPTHMPSSCTHDWVRFKSFLNLCSSGEVENPIVVDQSHQGPGLENLDQYQKKDYQHMTYSHIVTPPRIWRSRHMTPLDRETPWVACLSCPPPWLWQWPLSARQCNWKTSAWQFWCGEKWIIITAVRLRVILPA